MEEAYHAWSDPCAFGANEIMQQYTALQMTMQKAFDFLETQAPALQHWPSLMLDMHACLASEAQTAHPEDLDWLHDHAQICLDLLLASCRCAGPISGSALVPSQLHAGRVRTNVL